MAYPIVLAHGICRFDHLLDVVFDVDNRQNDDLHYFRRIRSTLLRRGFLAFHAQTPWAGGVDVRSRALRSSVQKVLRETGAEKVNIIAHSMGGLDARHMLLAYQAEALHERVASVTTIGTPHRGTMLANLATHQLRPLLRLWEALGIDLTGFIDLTTDECARFNLAAAPFEQSCGVAFRAYAGKQDFTRIFGPLKLTHGYLYVFEGENDGLVSVSSASWKPEVFAGTLDADHLNQIGWWDDGELSQILRLSPDEFERGIRRFYVDLARQLP